MKCHAVTEVKNAKGGSQLKVDWKYGNDDENHPFVRYSHNDHIEILGAKRSCTNCHILDKEVDYMATFKEFDSVNWKSNFYPIRKKTCMQCHSEDQINLECQNCHKYHFKPGFKKDMLTANAEHPSSTL